MRRAADVIEDLCGAGAGRLRRDDPLVVAALGGALRKALWRTQGCRWTRASDGIVREGLRERRKELAAENPAQGPHREEETGVSGEPALAVTR